MPRCPTCGHWSVDAADEWEALTHSLVTANGVRHRFTPQAWAILTLLRENAGRLVTRQEMIERLYRDRADGGPDDPQIDTRLAILRRQLAGSGYRLRNTPWAGYYLETTTDAG